MRSLRRPGGCHVSNASGVRVVCEWCASGVRVDIKCSRLGAIDLLLPLRFEGKFSSNTMSQLQVGGKPTLLNTHHM